MESLLHSPCLVKSQTPVLQIEFTSVLNYILCFHKIIVLYKLGQNTPQVKPSNVRQIVYRKKLELLIVKWVFWHIVFLNPWCSLPYCPLEYIADERVDEMNK